MHPYPCVQTLNLLPFLLNCKGLESRSHRGTLYSLLRWRDHQKTLVRTVLKCHLKNPLNKCISGDENGQETTTGIQTRNHDALTNTEDVSRDILEREVIGLRYGQ